MGQFGENYVLLEDGSGNVLLENDTGLDAFPDKVLLEDSVSASEVIINTDVNTDSGNRFNICQFSGFRALPGELVKSAYGEMSLPKFAEPRHMQERVRVHAENLEGSPRNEAADVFITDEITAEDL